MKTRRNNLAGFSLIDTMMAAGIAALFIAVAYASVGRAIGIARFSREGSLASELMQQRVDAFRNLTDWSQVVSTAGATQILSAASPVPAAMLNAVETATVSSYPPDGHAFTVTRSGGSVIATGSSLPVSQRCVQVTLRYSWAGPNRAPASRTLSTILTKGGV